MSQLTLFPEAAPKVRGAIIIAGSRNLDLSVAEMDRVVKRSGFTVERLISGGARGIDKAGERWAESAGIPIQRFPVSRADWRRYGGYAGHLRNQEMADVADGLIAIWDGISSGTDDMISRMPPARTFVHIIQLQP